MSEKVAGHQIFEIFWGGYTPTVKKKGFMNPALRIYRLDSQSEHSILDASFLSALLSESMQEHNMVQTCVSIW